MEVDVGEVEDCSEEGFGEVVGAAGAAEALRRPARAARAAPTSGMESADEGVPAGSRRTR